jgi:hypothetical protein
VVWGWRFMPSPFAPPLRHGKVRHGALDEG